MAYSERNLCETAENRARYETQPCPVPRRKVTPLYARVAAEAGEPDYIWDTAHSWDDHAGGLKGGRCTRCCKTFKEVRVRIAPAKRGHSSIAAQIARTPRDVPPVRIIGLRST
jgi:hypothetical protein